ncbi:MAG: hypothetical protein M3R02_18800 [Chloroflexota bacterium]|nr:hypothetical protein [Chloroflexota bacterium]
MTSLARTDVLSTGAPASHPDCPTCRALSAVLADADQRARRDDESYGEWLASHGRGSVAHLAPDLHEAAFDLAVEFFDVASREDRGLQDWHFREFLQHVRAIVVGAGIAAWNANPNTVPATAPRER